MRLERLFDRIPLAERAIPMLGSAEGFDSTHWPLERDAALAELAALRLPESAFTDHPSLALDLSAARRVAVEGLLAEDVHRDLHPTARGVGRLLLEAIQRDVLDPEELLAEAVALAALSPSGFPPNEVHAETRGGPQSPVGNEAHRVSPDVAIIIAGTGDDVSRCGIHEEIERAISFLRLGAVEVLEAAFAGCRQLLPPTGEIAVLWVGPSGAYLATSGPRCQLLRARRGELEWLHRRRERAQSAGSFEVHTIDAREGDTFLLLDDEAWAEAVTKASARGPVRGPSGTSPRDQMRQNFAAWLTGSTPVDLTPRVRRYLTGSAGFDDAAWRAWQTQWFGTGLAAVEQRLASEAATGRFCHGDVPGMADICLASIAAVMRVFKISVAGTPTVDRIVAACEELDAFQQAQPLRQVGAPT